MSFYPPVTGSITPNIGGSIAPVSDTPDRSYYANEVIALAQSGTGAVQRELADLSAAGLLTVSKQSNQKHYQANVSAPVFAELRSLVLKTMGLADVLRTALAPLAVQIGAAFIYGSVARQQDTAHLISATEAVLNAVQK